MLLIPSKRQNNQHFLNQGMCLTSSLKCVCFQKGSEHSLLPTSAKKLRISKGTYYFGKYRPLYIFSKNLITQKKILANQTHTGSVCRVTHAFLCIVLAENGAGGGNAFPVSVQCTHLAAVVDSSHSKSWQGSRQGVPGPGSVQARGSTAARRGYDFPQGTDPVTRITHLGTLLVCFSWQKSNASYSHAHFDTGSKRNTLDLYL